MIEQAKPSGGFVGYEYHSITVQREMESVYADGYENFGWLREGAPSPPMGGVVSMKFKRDRKMRNKAELTRLQRQFDACAGEIVALEKSKNARAVITAVSLGMVGCAFMAGATFSYLADILPLMVILAIPGFLGWILPYFCYRSILLRRGAQIAPLIEKKYDELYDVCEKASHLLT